MEMRVSLGGALEEMLQEQGHDCATCPKSGDCLVEDMMGALHQVAERTATTAVEEASKGDVQLVEELVGRVLDVLAERSTSSGAMLALLAGEAAPIIADEETLGILLATAQSIYTLGVARGKELARG